MRIAYIGVKKNVSTGYILYPYGKAFYNQGTGKTGAGMTCRTTDKMTRIQSLEMNEGGKKNPRRGERLG